VGLITHNIIIIMKPVREAKARLGCSTTDDDDDDEKNVVCFISIQ
jgi:hypothetical protein